jgi:P-type E1-E2 ATPase
MVKAGRERVGALSPATDVSESPGQGVRGVVEGKDVLVGSQAYVEGCLGGAFGALSAPALRYAQRRGSLVSFVAVGGEPAGVIVFSDQLRPGVPFLVQKLREMGVQHTVMLTGDNRTNASIIAREAGIERVAADLLPEQKVQEVKRLTAEYGPSIMVGDGINDAPALATATVGVAMGAHGTGISAEAADVVLLVDDITKVGDGMAIGQRMLRIAKQSIYFGMGGSLALMAVASLGYIEPAVGAMLQEVLDVAVILNALRAR